MITTLVFDWGDTIMVDFALPGPMSGWSKVAWIPGAEKVMPLLFMRYKCCIATSASHSGTEEMIKALSRVGADRYFHHFYSSRDLGFRKPEMGFFSTILDKLAIPAGQTVMIGNLYDKDIIGAKMCGMKTVLLTKEGEKADYPLADAVISHFEELPSVLERL
jgi:putative hydrolase of the HAD superfamily